jgi:hypothetical protein
LFRYEGSSLYISENSTLAKEFEQRMVYVQENMECCIRQIKLKQEDVDKHENLVRQYQSDVDFYKKKLKSSLRTRYAQTPLEYLSLVLCTCEDPRLKLICCCFHTDNITDYFFVHLNSGQRWMLYTNPSDILNLTKTIPFKSIHTTQTRQEKWMETIYPALAKRYPTETKRILHFVRWGLGHLCAMHPECEEKWNFNENDIQTWELQWRLRKFNLTQLQFVEKYIQTL